MAYYWKNRDSLYANLVFTVSTIPNHFVHQMEVRVGEFRWLVPKEYTDFQELHAQLRHYGVPQDLFPPRRPEKVSHAFVGESKTYLNNYLHTIIQTFRGKIPRPLQLFLEMNQHDCYFIVEEFYRRYVVEYDQSLPGSRFDISVMELHALCRVFKEPFPDIDEEDMLDYASILEVLNNFENLYLEGSETMYFKSPSKSNDLDIDFCFFKSLEKLQIRLIGFNHIASLGPIRNTLKSLKLDKVVMPTMGEFLLNDAYNRKIINITQMWPSLSHLILDNCHVTEIDISIQLLPNLLELRLANNQIKEIPDMRFITNLGIFDITNNAIEDWNDLHLKFNHIRMLHAGKNQVYSLQGFRNLIHLEYLNLKDNNITDFDEIVEYLVPLKKLQTIEIAENPVTSVENFEEKFNKLFKKDVAVAAVSEDIGVDWKEDKSVPKLGEASGSSLMTPRFLHVRPNYVVDDTDDDDYDDDDESTVH